MIFSMIYVMTSAVIIGHRMTKYAIGSYCTLGSIMESAVGNLCFIGCTCFKSWNAAEWANSTWDTAKGIEEPAATEMHIRYFLVLCCVFVLFVIMVHNVAFFRPAFHIMTHAVQIGQVVAALDIWTWSLASVPEAQLRPRKWRVKTFRLVLCHELMHFIELMMQGILSFFFGSCNKGFMTERQLLQFVATIWLHCKRIRKNAWRSSTHMLQRERWNANKDRLWSRASERWQLPILRIDSTFVICNFVGCFVSYDRPTHID